MLCFHSDHGYGLFLQLHHLFNLAHSFKIAIQKDRPLDYILKVVEHCHTCLDFNHSDQQKPISQLGKQSAPSFRVK